VTLTVVVSLAGLSVKSLKTVKVALFGVFVIVQEAVPFGVSVCGVVQPLAAYPPGTGFSEAVQVVLAASPVTVQTAGVFSLAGCEVFGTSVPAPQTSVTVTVVVSLLGLSVKFLKTVNVALLGVFVIVQDAVPFGVSVCGVVQPLAE
jgi:hypothetical protein